MLKNNKGITMIVLILTVIIMGILASISITASDSLFTTTKMKNATTNMILIRTKVVALYEDYSFNGTPTDKYIGKKLTDKDVEFITENVPSSYWSSGERNNWYKWDKEVLKGQGYSEDMIDYDEDVEYFYIVNYQKGEVIYTRGVKVGDNEILYKLSDLLKYDVK